jgi:hypothetical protein
LKCPAEEDARLHRHRRNTINQLRLSFKKLIRDLNKNLPTYFRNPPHLKTREGERRAPNLRTTTIRTCWTSQTGLTLVLAPVTLKISQALQDQRGGTLKGEPQRSFLSLISKEKKAVTPALSKIKPETHTRG